MTVALDAAAKMPLYLEFSGQATYGSRGFRFTGSTMGAMLTVTVTADYSGKSTDFALNINLEAWERKPIRRLPLFARLQQILETMSRAVPVTVQCTYEGIESDFSSGVIDGSERFRVLRAFMDEVSNLRKLDSFFDLNLSMPADLDDVLRDQGDISQLLAIIDIDKAEDQTVELSLVPAEPADELREIIASQRAVAIRLSQSLLNITVFGRDYGPFEVEVACPCAVVGPVGPAVVEVGVPIQLALRATEGNSWSARVPHRGRAARLTG
jgi:hypothetical protein